VDADGGGAFVEAGEAAAPLVTSALFINAMPSALSGSDSSLRFCWSTGSGFGGQPLEDAGPDAGFEAFPAGAPMPESNFPGVALGSAVLLPDAASLTGTLTLYAIRAIQLETSNKRDTPCDKLFCSGIGCLLSSTDYFQLPPVAIQRGAANIIVVEGCPPQADLASPLKTQVCGASYDRGLGNLHAEVVSVVPSKPTEAGIEVQVAQFSQGLADLLVDAGAATVSFVQPVQDASADTGTTALSTITTVRNEGQLAPSTPVRLSLGGLLASYGDVGIRLDLPASEAGAPSYFLTLAQAQELVAPAMDPRVYYGGRGTYVIAIVGDPSAPSPFVTGPEAGTYDGTGLHFVIAPAQP
jgi:hypothetical protein